MSRRRCSMASLKRSAAIGRPYLTAERQLVARDASFALTAFWLMVTLGRVIFVLLDRSATWDRYRGARPVLDYTIWGLNMRPRRMIAGHTLTVALKAGARVHWGVNGRKEVRDIDTRDTGLGVHVADLPVAALAAGETIQFTFLWAETQAWEGRDYEVLVIAA
jgi:hypothetical protein